MRLVTLVLLASVYLEAGSLDDLALAVKEFRGGRVQADAGQKAVRTALLAWLQERAEQAAASLVSPAELANLWTGELRSRSLLAPTAQEKGGGVLEPISSRLLANDLAVFRAGVAVGCGFDEVVQIYLRRGEAWQWIAADLADNPATESALAEAIQTIDFRADKDRRWVFVARGTARCAPASNPLVVRGYRIDAGAVTLGFQFARPNHDEAALALRSNEVLLHVISPSKEPEELHPSIYRYRLMPAVKRLQPVALTADEFVEEWLLSTWSDAAQWTAPGIQASAQKLHAAAIPFAASLAGRGECVDVRSHWQVGFDFASTSFQLPPLPFTRLTFLVRQIAPHQFEIAQVAQGSGNLCKPAIWINDEVTPHLLTPAQLRALP